MAKLVRDLHKPYTWTISAIDDEVASLHADARRDMVRSKPSEGGRDESVCESAMAD